MVLNKELQSLEIGDEQVLFEDLCDNDSQQERSLFPLHETLNDKIVSPGAQRERTYSIDSDEFSSDSATSIGSEDTSNPSFGEEAATKIGEADTVDETVNEMLSNIKETRTLDDESSIDTVEDGNFVAKAVEGIDPRREQRRKRIEAMDRNKRRGEALKKGKGKKKDTIADDDLAASIDSADDAIAAIEGLLATVYNENDDPSKNETTIPIEITTTKKVKKKKKKKKSKKSSKRKERKRKEEKHNASDADSADSWWDLSSDGGPCLSDDADDISNTVSTMQKSSTASFDLAMDSLRSAVSKDSSITFSTSRKRKGRSLKSESSRSKTYDDRKNYRDFVAEESYRSHSLRSIDEDADYEDIKNSGHAGTTRVGTKRQDDLSTIKSNVGESDKSTTYSGYGGAMTLNDMISEAAAKRQERLSSRLPFQSPSGNKESLSSRIRKKPSFPAPLSPQPAESKEAPKSLLELMLSKNDDEKPKQKKNSGSASVISMNDMIAEAAAKRQERVASKNSPKLNHQSPGGNKESLSSRIRKKPSFPAPLSPQSAESKEAPKSLLELMLSKNDDEKPKQKKNSGSASVISMNDMIAEAAAKRQERVASKNSPKLNHQSPGGNKESLSSRIQDTPSFPAPLSPQPAESKEAPKSLLELMLSKNDDEKSKQKKNSGSASVISMNDMIAEAAAKRQERVASKKSPGVNKESLSSRLQKKDFASPLSLQTSEVNAISVVEEVDNSSVASMTRIGLEEKNHDINTRDVSADTKLIDGGDAEEINSKPKTFQKFEPTTLNEQQRKEARENHRKIFLPVVDEAATYGRLVRLEEEVVEAQGGANQHRDDGFSTWTGPKLRTDDRRSSALRAIQEAAAMGRMKRLAPEIVTNHIENDGENESSDHFDIENQIDEDGEKICRTNFLLDRHVKEILQGKKERMFTCSDAVGDRDEKIASYKDFDDVKLPTEILPTFDQILGRRANNKSYRSGADLAVIAMQMSQRNLKVNEDGDDEDDDFKMRKRLRVLERISSVVADSAMERDARLQRPNAALKVTRKCKCPYCKDPNPYQTHKYRRLMYSAQFDENTGENNHCQKVGETIGSISDAAKADTSVHTISPGGRKKKVIRIVRRKKRRPEGLQPAITGVNSNDKSRVVHGTSLKPEELDLLKKLQTQGANGMTTEELELIAHALRDKTSTTANKIPETEQGQQASGPDMQISDLPSDRLIQPAAGTNSTGLVTEQIVQLERKILLSPRPDNQPNGVYPVSQHAPKVAYQETTSDSIIGDNPLQKGDREENLTMPASLPFENCVGNESSPWTEDDDQPKDVDPASQHAPKVANQEATSEVIRGDNLLQKGDREENLAVAAPLPFEDCVGDESSSPPTEDDDQPKGVDPASQHAPKVANQKATSEVIRGDNLLQKGDRGENLAVAASLPFADSVGDGSSPPTEDVDPASQYGGNSLQEGDREENVIVPASAPFADNAGDGPSTPIPSTPEDVVDTTAKRLPTETTIVENSENDAMNQKSPQVPTKGMAEFTALPKSPSLRKPVLPKSPSLRKPALPKSPSLRKPRKILSAPPNLFDSEKVSPGAHVSSTKYYSPQGRKKMKIFRRRPKEVTKTTGKNDATKLLEPPSVIEEVPRKKSLRSRLRSLTGSASGRSNHGPIQVSNDSSQNDKDSKSKSNRERGKRSPPQDDHPELHPPTSIDNAPDEKERKQASFRREKDDNELPTISIGVSHENTEKIPTSHSRSGRLVQDSGETLLPRARKRNETKCPKSTSSSHPEGTEQTLQVNSRAQSLPIGQNYHTAQDGGEKLDEPPKALSLPQEKILAHMSLQGDGSIRKPPSRSRSLQGAPKQKGPATTLPPKNINTAMSGDLLSKTAPPIPSFITISLETKDHGLDWNSNSNSTVPTFSETPDSSESSNPAPKQRRIIKKPRKIHSLDGQKVKKTRKSRSLEPTRIRETAGRRSRSKGDEGRSRSKPREESSRSKSRKGRSRSKAGKDGSRSKSRKGRSRSKAGKDESRSKSRKGRSRSKAGEERSRPKPKKTRSRSEPRNETNETQLRKIKKADKAGPDKGKRATKMDAPGLNLSQHSNRQEPQPAKRRSRSLDRSAIQRPSEQGNGDKIDTGTDRLRKNFKPRSWFNKKGNGNPEIN